MLRLQTNCKDNSVYCLIEFMVMRDNLCSKLLSKDYLGLDTVDLTNFESFMFKHLKTAISILQIIKLFSD